MTPQTLQKEPLAVGLGRLALNCRLNAHFLWGHPRFGDSRETQSMPGNRWTVHTRRIQG